MTNMLDDFPPPTPEQWARTPWPVKAWIVATVFFYSWEINLAYGWLKVQGINVRI